MTGLMKVLMLVLGILACYFPAVAGARGRGSRKLWIRLILVGLFVAAASVMLGRHLLGAFEPVLFSQAEGESFARRMTVNLLAAIVRVSASFCFGSILAALLYRKHRADPSSPLGLDAEINKRQI